MSDGLFFGGIVVAFFVLWAVTGGPTRPISFAGAYITPITNVDQTQSGYGPKVPAVSTSLSLGGAGVSVKDTASTPTAISSDSSYKGQVTVSRSMAASSVDPSNKYVHLLLTSKASATVRITNWRFVSSADHGSVVISNSDASLAPGTSTVVVTSFPAATAHDTIQLEDSSGKLVSSFTY